MIKKGEIWIVDIPQLGGREQQGVRPAIIVADTKTPVVIVIPCTSSLEALRFMYTLLIEPSKGNGLNASSIALLFQVRAIDKKRLIKKIGILDKTVLRQISNLLKKLFSL